MHSITRSTKRKKAPEITKQELLASIVEVLDEEEDCLEMNERGKKYKGAKRRYIFNKKV